MLDLDALDNDAFGFTTVRGVDSTTLAVEDVRALIDELRAARKVVEAARQVRDKVLIYNSFIGQEQADLETALAELEAKQS